MYDTVYIYVVYCIPFTELSWLFTDHILFYTEPIMVFTKLILFYTELILPFLALQTFQLLFSPKDFFYPLMNFDVNRQGK